MRQVQGFEKKTGDSRASVGQRLSRWLLLWGMGLLLFHPAPPVQAFLYVEKGLPLPHLVFTDLQTGMPRDFDQNRQQPLILVFWGADLDTKRERAIEVLAEIQASRAFYEERGVELAAVFVQPEELFLADEVLARTGLAFPVYVDGVNQAFAALGVYVMPSILIVDKDGIIHETLTYNHNLDEIVPGEVQVMLNEINREELAARLHPEVVERSTAERRARLDYHYAMNLIQRGKIDLALDTLNLALEKDGDFIPALVEKGCLLIKKKDFQGAHEFLDRSLAQVADFERAIVCNKELAMAESEQGREEAPAKLNPASWAFFADSETVDDDVETAVDLE